MKKNETEEIAEHKWHIIVLSHEDDHNDDLYIFHGTISEARQRAKELENQYVTAFVKGCTILPRTEMNQDERNESTTSE